MIIQSKVIDRLNKSIIEAHLREDRVSIDRLHNIKYKYLKRWL